MAPRANDGSVSDVSTIDELASGDGCPSDGDRVLGARNGGRISLPMLAAPRPRISSAAAAAAAVLLPEDAGFRVSATP